MNNKKAFKSPYLGIDSNTFSHVFTQNGDYSVIIKIQNPVIQFAADYEAYTKFHQLMNNLIQILGPGHAIQKLDIFHTKKYQHPSSPDFLEECYFSHFRGRSYAHHTTYLVLTKNEKGIVFSWATQKHLKVL
jgi:hypothetical protein